LRRLNLIRDRPGYVQPRIVHQRGAFRGACVMFESTILDVAVGLVFTFLGISLASSAVVEAIASAMKWRSATLVQGVKDLLNDADFNKLAKTLYDHSLISPLEMPNVVPGNLALKPAYIDPRQFADALMQSLDMIKGTPDELKAKIAASPMLDAQIKTYLNGVVDRTDGAVVHMRDEVSAWFDNAMDRVSGAYKRKTQVYLFVIALLLALGLNVDAVQIGSALWHQPMVTKTIQPVQSEKFDAVFADLERMDLPVGWTQTKWTAVTAGPGGAIYAVIGWLITAFATLFGAPFWFDTLQQFVRLKGAGPSPTESKDGTAAAA
jgi:hypothetical protein